MSKMSKKGDARHPHKIKWLRVPILGTVIAITISRNPSRPGFRSSRAARGDCLGRTPKEGVPKDA